MKRKIPEEVVQLVMARDQRTGYRLAVGQNLMGVWMSDYAAIRRYPLLPCVAWQLDPSLWGTCSGRLTLDHVHCRGMTSMTKKAPNDPRHLQMVCEWHHGTIRVGGGWITSRTARNLARDRLEALHGTD